MQCDCLNNKWNRICLIPKFNEIDVEELCEKIDLSERGLIVQTRKHLMNKMHCNQRVLRKIVAEYEEQRAKAAKAVMAVALVGAVPTLLEKSGVLKFKSGAGELSAKIFGDENTMFRIMDLLPVDNRSNRYMKYFCAAFFMSSLCINNVGLGSFKNPFGSSGADCEQELLLNKQVALRQPDLT